MFLKAFVIYPMIKNLLLLSVLLLSTYSAFAQSPIDTLNAELDDIIVVGYQGNRSILETPGSISFIKPEYISGFDNSSLLYGFSTVAGVTMEQRAPASYRIAIRGSSIRSPFGIRNVKVYWNDIPLTEPTGSTFLNLLAPSNMQSVEVIKGPGGSLYGAGNGGVLLINSSTSVFSDQISLQSTIGSFGTFNNDLGYTQLFDKGQFSLKYSNSNSDGFREQSFLDRHAIELTGTTEYNEGKSISASILYSDLNYGIPGGLDENQFQDDPTQARGGPIGSVVQNASIIHESLLIGLNHRLKYSDNFENEFSVFGSFSDFENPFNFDYKVDDRKSGGLRTINTYTTNIGETALKITFGAEVQASNYDSKNYGNNGGELGTLNFDDELKVSSSLIFLQSQLDLKNDWYLTAGLSLNSLTYDINREVATAGNGEVGIVNKDFDPQIIPRIALAKRITTQLTAHASISSGFSPPTIEEIRTNEGSINLDLEAEKGLNYEIGLRGNAFNGRLGFDAVAFYYSLKESITRQPSEIREDTFVFKNVGSTDQKGLELSANYILIENYSSIVERMRINVAYTRNDFKFDDYSDNGNDFSGNKLTGIAPNILFTSLEIDTEIGLYGTLSYTFNDEVPLRDDNTLSSDSYQLVQSKIGYKATFFSQLDADIYLGIDNLLDERYSLGFDSNAFGGRYYQPAAERNWFLGLKLTYKLN